MSLDKRPDSAPQIEQGGLREIAAQALDRLADHLPTIGDDDIADFSFEGVGEALP
jgi:hypothetical protein